MQLYKNLFIDLDDTLWDTESNNRECLEEMYADYGMSRHYASFEAFYSIYMPRNMELWALYRNGRISRRTLIIERFRHVLSPLGISEVSEIDRVNRDFLERTAHKTKTIPGAHELMEYLHARYRTFILSNGFREVQARKLEASGLSPFFNGLILSEDAGIHKPNKEIFYYALMSTNSRRTQSLMIGDSWEADMVGARNARIHQMWFNPSCRKSRGFKPTYTVASLHEIAGIL